MSYYGIVAALPELPRKGVEGFRPVNIALQYRDLLPEPDFQALQQAYISTDHINILHALAGRKQFVAGGNYPEDEIRRITQGEWTPWPYIGEFLSELRERGGSVTTKEADRLLTHYWYRHLLQSDQPLLAEWALIRLRLRIHAYQSAPESLRAELQAEREILTECDPGENAPYTGMPEPIPAILRQPDLSQRESDLDDWCWDFLEERVRFAPFSLEALIGYALRQQICARRSAFLSSKPELALDKLVQGALSEVL